MADELESKKHSTFMVQKTAGSETVVGAGADCVVVIYTKEPTLLGKRFELDAIALRIGRGGNCHIVLDEESVSRKHAHIETHDDQWWVADDRSTNGTYVNDKRIDADALLVNGDRIAIGQTIFKYLSGRDLEAMYHDEIYRMTITDGLTGAHVKRYLLEALEKEATRARAHARALSLVMLDIDHIKRVNDFHGHLGGDFVLREVAKIVRSRLRLNDVFARYGGEEFAVILPETNLEDAKAFADGLRERIDGSRFTFQNDTIHVTISLGAAAFGDQDSTSLDLIQRAEGKLYDAKRSGRNRVCAGPDASRRRLLDGPTIVERALAEQPSTSALVALALEPPVPHGSHDAWLRALADVAETSLEEGDLLGTWRETYVVASIKRNRGRSPKAVAERIANAFALQGEAIGETRRARTAWVTSTSLQRQRERALDALADKLRVVEPTPIDASLSERLPFPIAAPQTVVASHGMDTQSRAAALAWAIECATLFVAAVEIAMLRELDQSARDALVQLIKGRVHYGEKRLGMGDWVSLAIDLAKLLQGRAAGSPTAIVDVANALAPGGTEGELARALRAAVSLRNDKLAHAVPSADGSDVSANRELERTLRLLVDALLPLAVRTKLVSVAKAEIRDEETTAYEVHHHVGAITHPPRIELVSSARLVNNWCYLLDDGAPPLLLAPFVMAVPCELCRGVEVALARKIALGREGEAVVGVGVTTNHELNATLPRARALRGFYDDWCIASGQTIA